MRYMILVKASADSEAGLMPGEDMLKAMADYHEELAKAGVLVDGNGLHPTSKGYRLHYSDGKRTLIDGPFAETKEVIAGYTMIKVKSTEEALHWFQRFPQPHYTDCEIELRRMFELEELGEGEEIDRFREMEVDVKGT
ncbi:YciI family protein [Hyphomicrobium sp.]|uniref:YciI family protein n=1 Tax=Hyphomicrobium sp. TaxID=82 RepID=UPI0025C5154F|nr:YciI family protein [Hyphomicrobium sp.]MCC7252806.1 YciI family protein [Hyphomicrobium sp.]